MSHGLLIADALISATAIVSDLQFASKNLRDYRFVEDLQLLSYPNPFQESHKQNKTTELRKSIKINNNQENINEHQHTSMKINGNQENHWKPVEHNENPAK